MTKLAVLSIALAVMALTPAWGAAVTDQYTVFNPDHSILAQFTLFDDGSYTGGSCLGACGPKSFSNLYYITDSTLADQSSSAPSTLLFDSISTGVVSDIFGTASISGGVFLAFESAGATDNFVLSFPFPGFLNLVETGGPVDATAYLAPARQDAGYTATFYSGDDPAVPEPGTVLLLAIGFAGIAGSKITGRR